ncbi:hypothetical protein [Paludisphaera soli]|uniref:hypothetical protein n=1 Tax=Paludisphaera soli TaxID=2712865 RepID=UPI0013ED2535|nr:hypothetical protein [Paludisphaera soli]
MVSPSSGSPAPATRIENDLAVVEPLATTTGAIPPARRSPVVIVDLGRAIAAGYAAFVDEEAPGRAVLIAAGGSRPGSRVDSAGGRFDQAGAEGREVDLVLVLGLRRVEDDLRNLDDLLRTFQGVPIRFVGVVSSFRVHLDDAEAEGSERLALQRIRSIGPGARVAVFRPGHVLGPGSEASRLLTRFASLAPLVPGRFRSCFVDGAELFAAIEAERGGDDGSPAASDANLAGRVPGGRERFYTQLGVNAPWREMLERHRDVRGGSVARAVATGLAWLGVGQAAGLAASLLSRWTSWGRAFDVRTLKPRSFGELISLCHRGNIDRVRVVGYNNGVNHFGHRHPGRTVVSTVLCRRAARVRPGRLKADCGATIRDALDCLSPLGEDLYVIPNYSYVALGTSFFVPIHGSSVDYATVADTIDRVVLYDPSRDRIISASRDEDAFRDNVYDLRSPVVVLRLLLRTKPKASYFVRRETRFRPAADEILDALRDDEATNVEVRQSHAAAPGVTISRYYNDPGDASGAALELPRDALGRLWDRLEENPVTSFLMHALSRRVAWHTELFLTPREFEVFWRKRAEVPLRKIQLRYIRRDGMPHSPFREEDNVSADLFMFRTSKPAFDALLRKHLPAVRTNPGKHSH